MKWSSLRPLMENNTAKFSLLFPIVGYVILYNDAFVSFICNSRYWGECGENNWIWKLDIVYCGILFFSIGALLYFLGCPRVQRKYLSAEDFVQEYSPLISDAGLKFDYFARRPDLGDRFGLRILTAAKEAGGLKTPTITKDTPPDSFQSIRGAYLSIVYEESDLQKPVLRRCISVFAIVGLGMASFPSILVVMDVLRSIYVRYAV